MFLNINMKKSFLTLLLSSLIAFTLIAQIKEKRIYVLDATKSMMGHGNFPEVWSEVKPQLIKNIQEVNEAKADLVLFTFADKVYQTVKGKDEIIKFLNGFEPDLIKYTNIHSGWEGIQKHIDPSKFNFVTFITDGVHNIPTVSKKDLLEIIKLSDKSFGTKNTFACFIRLTGFAVDEETTSILESANNITYLDGIKFPVIVRPKQNPITINLRDNKVIEETLFFDVFNEIDLPENYKLTIKIEEEDGDNLKLQQTSFEIKKGSNSIKIPIKPNGNFDAVANETVSKGMLVLGKEDSNIILINNQLPLSIVNKPERFATIDINPNFGKLNNYPSFLFWDEKIDTVKQTVKINWSEDAKAANSIISLEVNFDGLTYDQFGITYNNQVVNNSSITLDPTVSEFELGIFMAQKTPEGKKHGHISLDGTRLDRSNISEPLDTQLKFSHDWNPLMTILMWTGIAILAMLLIWFLVLRNIYFKKFNKTFINISDPYFKKVNLHRGRMVVFSPKPVKQNIVSRIFKGKVINEVNPIWEKPLTFYPGKNKLFPIKSLLSMDYTLDPYAANLEKYKDYVITSSKQKIKLNIN